MHKLIGVSGLSNRFGDFSNRFNYFFPTFFSTFAVFLIAAMLLPGCASAPIPSEQFAISQTAIDNATAAGATEYAPLEIKNARDKLAAAHQAVDQKEYPAAAALAEEASVDAKLAQTKAASEKAKKSVAEIQDNLRTLQDEINRNSQQQEQSEQQRSGQNSAPM
jgi:hypothetical protein